jgi:prepilin-type N-terminal cleavage/methylation domain-containing protein
MKKYFEEKGFTLVEMVVVIAVIGILASAVFAALGPSRAKAKNSRIIGSTQQARVIVEGFYNGTSGQYNLSSPNNLGTANSSGAPPFANAELITLAGDIVNNDGEITIEQVTNGEKGYRIFSKLNGNSGYYCVNHLGTVYQSLPGVSVPATVSTTYSCQPAA